MNRLLTKSVSATIYLAVVACGSMLAQTSNPPKGSTKVFGLPVSKSDSSKDAPATKGETAAALTVRNYTTTSKGTSEAEILGRMGTVSKVFVAIEGTKQGKFTGLTPLGKNPEIECLRYVLEPQGSSVGGRSKPSITITKESDAASSQLLLALETSEALKTVAFTFVEGEGGAGKIIARANLMGATIVGINQHFDSKTHGVFEDITLNFIKIEFGR